MILEREHIVSIARTWVGVPYQHLGRRKDKSVDCVGLIIGVGQELGLKLKAPHAYSPSPASNLVLRYADEQLVKIEDNSFALGRVAVMWGMDRGEAQHLGIIGSHNGNWTLIHAFSKAGKVVETHWDAFWKRRIYQIYEFPGTRPLEARDG